jgi:hypothetical protein
MVDDNLFVAPFSVGEQVAQLTRHVKALGFSLRLGRNTTYCYPLRRDNPLPAFDEVAPSLLRYDWTRAVDAFAYPLEVSSSLYRADDLRPLLVELAYQNPNTLESEISKATFRFTDLRPELLCYERSVAFSAPLNIVQQVFENRSSDRRDYSAEALARAFEDGQRIDVGAYAGMVPNGCHAEVDLRLAPRRVVHIKTTLRRLGSRLLGKSLG